MVVNLARPMLEAWPDAFMDFAKQTGLSQEHLSGAELLMPDWMCSAVYRSLRKQNRVSVEAVSAQIAAMQSAGLRVTKQALRARLGSDSKAIRVLLPGRRRATWWELRAFARRMTSKRQRRRRRQTVALVRNQLHVILAVLSGQTLDAVASMSTRPIHASTALASRQGLPSACGCAVVRAERQPRASMASRSRDQSRAIGSIDDGCRVCARVRCTVIAGAAACTDVITRGGCTRRGDPARAQARRSRCERRVADLGGRRLCGMASRAAAMIRIDAWWLCTQLVQSIALSLASIARAVCARAWPIPVLGAATAHPACASPRLRACCIKKPSGLPIVRQQGEPHSRSGAFGHGLVSAMTVQIGGGVAWVGSVNLDAGLSQFGR